MVVSNNSILIAFHSVTGNNIYVYFHWLHHTSLHQIATVIFILRYIITNKVLNIDRCKITNFAYA